MGKKRRPAPSASKSTSPASVTAPTPTALARPPRSGELAVVPTPAAPAPSSENPENEYGMNDDMSESLPSHVSVDCASNGEDQSVDGGGGSPKWKRCKRKKGIPVSPKSKAKRSGGPSLANYGGEILVLFETPSGFAIFGLKEYCLNQQNAMENIWAIFGEDFRAQEIVCLKEFQIFKDKSSAINHGGVSEQLTKMISRYYPYNHTLAVGKPEYKRIIETSLPGVCCRFDEAVLEVMWGLQNLMHSSVPQEELKLTKEDRLPMSQGLKKFLKGYGFNVKPGMIKEYVVVTACRLRDAELMEKRHFKQLRWAADKLKVVFGINSEGWDMMKIATALKIIFDYVEITDDDLEMFTEEESSTLERDDHKYVHIIRKDSSLKIYSELVEMRAVKKDLLEMLAFCFS